MLHFNIRRSRTFINIIAGVFITIWAMSSMACGGGKKKEPIKAVSLPLPPKGSTGSVLLRFQAEVKNPPALFKKRPVRFRYRVYVCSPNELTKEKHNPKKKKVAACLTRFYEKSGPATGLGAKFQMNVPGNWTHAFIELLDTEEVAGRYSPGHNPRWFRNKKKTGAASGTLRGNFEFQSQENPLPDALQEKLAAKFAPIIVLKKGKKYIPTNLEKYAGKFKRGTYPMKQHDLRRLQNGRTTMPYLDLVPAAAGGATHLYYHVRYADTMVSGAHPDALPGMRDDRNYRYRKGNGDMVVSYWLWYDMNEGPTSFGNVHQGDLESFAVLTDANGRPKRFMVTGHDYIMLDTPWTNINSVNHHPIIYIAYGNKGADGGNPTSAYGGFEVKLEAGSALFNFVSDPRDIFPSLAGAGDKAPQASVILPADLDPNSLGKVRIGPGKHLDAKGTFLVDLKPLALRKIARLVNWEEPGWVNRPADIDPDGHHRVDPAIAPFLVFPGRIGKHPQGKMRWGELKRYGQSPENVPFKTNVEQHYTFEKPRKDRFYKGRVGDYRPRFKGDGSTPQFVR